MLRKLLRFGDEGFVRRLAYITRRVSVESVVFKVY